MASAKYRYYLLILLPIFWFLADAQAYKNVTVGDFLVANDDNRTWASPSGDFAFGFVPYLGGEQQFLLAIWFDQISDKAVVWSANRDTPADRGSRVELSPSGKLVLSSSNGHELWSSSGVIHGTESLHAAMLDTGNFVVASGNSSIIWESFHNPTDTILPTQDLGVGTSLTSMLSERSSRIGNFQLRFSNGELGLFQIDKFSGKPFRPYYNISDGSRLIFNQSGHIMVMKSNGNLVTLAPINAAPSADSYYRATLSYDGVFTLYSHSKTNRDDNWSVLWPVPDNICGQFVNFEARRGSGPCGYNSICESDTNNRPTCSCPPGFSFLDEANQHAGCKPDYQSSQDCSPDGVVMGEDRFEFRTAQFVDWPFSDYSTLLSVNEAECRQSCLLDCSCVVAILLDPVFNNGSGVCWKKKLPLLNGRLNRSDASLNRKVLIKVLKSNEGGLNLPVPSNNSRGNDNEVILILAVLLGTSAFFNFFSLAAIALVLFCLYRRKMRHFMIQPCGRELEMNLRCFSYKELESATGGFKEDLGRGAFGTVYKGEILSSSGRNLVAVKKLDKIVQEGEKEFKTEVNVIGQTHHRNLVRLVGYCDEGEHRMLVYEFMQNGSLSSLLFAKLLRPGWDQRLRIASGIAKGLAYLHEECDSQIIHCDIKPQNILLDDSFTAKISDFGLAKLMLNNKTRTMTGVRGTKGYVAPEWFRNTPVTVKVDVYSFGVMLLEIICCRKCVEFELEEEAILTEWAYQCYIERMVEKLVEKDEEARSDMRKVETLVKIALWCVQGEAVMRPSMRTVTMMLEGVAQVPNPPSPFPFSSSMV